MIKKLNTFSIEYFSEAEQTRFEGKFTARIASMMDKNRISVRRSQLLGGMYTVRDEEGKPTGRGIDEDTEWTAHMLAWIDVTLVQKPEWFKLEGENAICDDAVVLKVFAEVMKFENSFRGGGKPAEANGSGQSGEGTGKTQPSQADAGNAPTKVVGVEVQAALEP